LFFEKELRCLRTSLGRPLRIELKLTPVKIFIQAIIFDATPLKIFAFCK
jgi:hypothetical protein